MARMKANLDIWECENCGEAVVMGRRCPKCKTSYADKLIEEHQRENKPRRKLRKPAEEREFTKSYMFKKSNQK